MKNQIAFRSAAIASILVYMLLAGLLLSRARAQVAQVLSEEEKYALLEILPDEAKKQFNALPDAESQAQWARLFWKRQDPTPTTERNERYDEFRRRLDYALLWFSAPTKSGFDDRGRIYIKYGEPSERYTQPVGSQFVKPNESWSYSQIAPGMVFDFVSRGTYYRLVDDLSQAISARTEPALEFANLQQLYEDRIQIDPFYHRIANELQRIGNQPYGAMSAINEARALITESVSEAQAEKIKLPPSVYKHDYHARPIAIAESMARFRRGEGKVRVEIYFGVPYNQLAFEQAGNAWASAIKAKISIFDPAYRTIAADSIAGNVFARNAETMHTGAYVSQFNFDLPPGEYHAALRIESKDGKRVGIVRSKLLVPAYPVDGLAMSDLELASQLIMIHHAAGEEEKPPNPSSPLARFTKHNLRIAPLPGLSVEKSRTLFVYFEIYNLQPNAAGDTEFELNYTLRALHDRGRLPGLRKDRKPQLSISETRRGTGGDQREFIGIDLSMQEEGKYLLTVAIRDKNSGQEAEASVPVRVVAANK